MREKYISFVLAGKNRRNILGLFNQETLTPAQILKKANYT